MTSMERFRRECAAFLDDLSVESQKPLVFGEGNDKNPALMLIGEAPGEQEALLGRPFVGRAGKNLDAFLEAVQLRREEIYITNVVKIRPTRVSAAGRVVNRPPTREEKALFTPWLMREIALVRPDALVTLGNVALQAFVEDVVGARHGRWTQAVVTPPEDAAFTLPMFSLYHPASVLYNGSLRETYQRDLHTLSVSLHAVTGENSDI